MNTATNVFSGENAVLDFINPDKNAPTPLVEVPRELNPFYNDHVHLYVKLMNCTALGNVKSLPAFNMIKRVDKKNTHTIIENSSGNTVFSLAVIGRLLGIQTTKAYVSNEVSEGKLQLLRLLGTEPIVNKEPICPNPNDTTSGIYKAKTLGQQEGWINPGQYDNEDNPQAHYQWTGPQIWNQLNGNIQLFVAGLGTTGTVVGTGRYLKEQNKNIRVVGVSRMPNNPVPGVRTENLLQQVHFDWKSVVDDTVLVGTVNSYKMSLQLCRYGLLVGPSSGFAFQGMIDSIQKMKDNNVLEKMKDTNGEFTAVCICCDSPYPYLSEYFEYLDDSQFPSIQNAELLVNRERIKKTQIPMNTELSAQEAYQKLFTSENKPIISEKQVLLDVRTDEEYQDTHIPGSIQISHEKILANPQAYISQFAHKEVFVYCKSGGRSGQVTQVLTQEGIHAVSIQGGIIEWSQRGYPRTTSDECKI
ncbi:pyridoxal-phosphate dependent enzyme [Candidatus Woesebacteria bacterium]|jgi:cysteine synthase/rhodanese-related sulfurtransferase|nr:pyridoxal-phosphate dependent enzyme [Candidatus Woesebacteria bacterium]